MAQKDKKMIIRYYTFANSVNIHLIKMTESSCFCVSKAFVSNAFLNAVTDIKREYEREIDKLNTMLQQKDIQIYELKESINKK